MCVCVPVGPIELPSDSARRANKAIAFVLQICCDVMGNVVVSLIIDSFHYGFVCLPVCVCSCECVLA